jgi:saccharopine dehydrogenase-like NADP-dependent oxidoreductase
MGKGIIRDLVSKESKDIERVVIADVSVEREKGIVEELRDRRLEAVRLDISDSETAENRLCIGLS